MYEYLCTNQTLLTAAIKKYCLEKSVCILNSGNTSYVYKFIKNELYSPNAIL